MSIQTAIKARFFYYADGTSTSLTCPLAGTAAAFVVMGGESGDAPVALAGVLSGPGEVQGLGLEPTSVVATTAGVTAAVSWPNVTFTFEAAPTAGDGHVDATITLD
jgi:hypothetical protein